MKKNVSILLIVLLVLVISTLVLFAEEAKYDFRKTNWGMSKEQVKATEDKKPDGESDIINDVLYYKTKIGNNNFEYLYYFLEDKLYSGFYLFTGEHTNENLYIDDYEELKEILAKKYGKPIIDEVIWENDLYKDDKSEWGIAISVGDLTYWALWETPTTEICLMLRGDNYEITLGITYKIRELKKWIEKIEEEKTKSNF